MALDGAFLHQLRREIWDRAQEARIDNISPTGMSWFLCCAPAVNG